MGIIRTAILTGGGIYAVNKIAKTAEIRHETRSGCQPRSQPPRDEYYDDQPQQRAYTGPPPPAEPSREYRYRYGETPQVPPQYQERHISMPSAAAQGEEKTGFEGGYEDVYGSPQQQRPRSLWAQGQASTSGWANRSDPAPRPAYWEGEAGPLFPVPRRQQSQTGFVVPESDGGEDYFEPRPPGAMRGIGSGPASGSGSGAAMLERGLEYAGAMAGGSRKNKGKKIDDGGELIAKFLSK